MMILPPQVNTAISMLYAAGYEAFLVGGAVRDYVRDNSPAKDWDITTNAVPVQVESVFSGYHLIETGLKHGTVTVVIDHEPIETQLIALMETTQIIAIPILSILPVA